MARQWTPVALPGGEFSGPPIGACDAVLDSAHVGDIRGAFGTIAHGDTAARRNWRHRWRTLLAVLGPGLIVMVGDNDAGAFSTYSQAGQDYGTALLWTLLLLVPVLYVNQEMVLRLGAVTGVGHARLILARFGRFWGAFSVIDLILLNALTLVTEFIGISLGLDVLGVPRPIGVLASACLLVGAGLGDLRRFERVAMALVFGSLLLVPLFLWIHPPLQRVAHDALTPQLPAGGKLGDVMLLIIGIVGTTIAPWQLFFQQSYVIDKRITPRFMRYERIDLWIGIAIVIAGALAMMAAAAATFDGRPGFGHFTDTAGVAQGMAARYGHPAGVLFAVALIDASLIGACAVSLSTAYAIGDVFAVNHSLHRRPDEAKSFYAVHAGLIAIAAVLVLTPGTPLGMLVGLVQSLAGVLLPSATVFLLLLCNDGEVLGPWVNSRRTNLFTGAVVSVLVILSMILTAAVLFPALPDRQIAGGLVAGGVLAALLGWLGRRPAGRSTPPLPAAATRAHPADWRMPPLHSLAPASLSVQSRLWMMVLRAYLVVAAGLLIAKMVHLAIAGH